MTRGSIFSTRADNRRVFAAAERLAGFSMSMSSLEALTDHRELDPDGIRRPSPLHGQDPQKAQITRILFKAMDRKWVLVGLHTARVAAGAVLTLSPDRGRYANTVRGSLAAFLAVSEGCLSLYNRYGSDGADQAAMQALAPAAFGRLGGSKTVENAAIWYTGIQGVLSYTVAGVAKLLGQDWRRGTAVEGILRTNAYGHETLWGFLSAHPRISKALTWGTVLWELSYPLALLPLPALTKMYSASAMVFHFANAHFMGLGRFAWAFASLHPAITAIADPRRPVSSSQLPKTAVSAMAVATGALGASAVLRNLNLRSLPFGWHREKVASGNSLAIQHRKGTGAYLLIIEAGLGAPSESYQWFFNSLCESSTFSVLMYERAGYGASKLARKNKKHWTLEAAVDDLESIATEYAHAGQRVVMIGHSMGGELIRRLIKRDPSLVDLTILIDSTNVNQFVDGPLSRSDIQNLEDSFRVQRNRTIVGLGGLMNPTPSANDLPRFVRKRGVSAERNHRLWTAALREYRGLLRDLPEKQIELFEGAVPRLVYAAQTTMELETTRLLQEQLFHSGINPLRDSRAGVETVPGRHDTMFTTPEHGVLLAQRVLSAVESTGRR